MDELSSKLSFLPPQEEEKEGEEEEDVTH